MNLTKSSLLHLLIILVFLNIPNCGGGKEEGEGKGANPEQTQIEILPPEAEDAVEVPDPEMEALKKRAPHAADKCASSFGGIGIQQGSFTVVDVYAEYPAAKAGIQVGDEILSTGEIRGEVGTPVSLLIRRGSQIIRFNLIRDKICTS